MTELAAELNLVSELPQARLAARGVTADGETQLKIIAEEYDSEAVELLKMMLIDGYGP